MYLQMSQFKLKIKYVQYIHDQIFKESENIGLSKYDYLLNQYFFVLVSLCCQYYEVIVPIKDSKQLNFCIQYSIFVYLIKSYQIINKFFNMQRWEEKERKRIHDMKIQNVKSTFQKNSRSREKPLTSSRSKQLNHSITHQHHQPALPFTRILQIFQLQQYSNLLQFYGFPHRLKNKAPLEEIDEMIQKVAKNDKQRFISLLNTLALMSKGIKSNSQHSIHKNKRTSLLSRSQKTTHMPPSVNSKASSKQIQYQKSDFLRQRTKQIKNSHFRIRKTPNESIQKKSTEKKKTVTPFMNSKKNPVITKKVQSKDDAQIIHQFKHGKKGKPLLIEEGNSIIKKLYNKIHHKEPTGCENQKKAQQLDLQMKKIKQLYLSYDSGSLASNIINIDLQQTIGCLASQIIQLIEKGKSLNIKEYGQKQQYIEKLLKESFLPVKQQSKGKQQENYENQQFQQPQQHIVDRIQTPPSQKQGKKGQQLFCTNFERKASSDAEAISVDQQSITDKSSASSGFTVENNMLLSSYHTDFASCFSNRFTDSTFSYYPKKEDVKNFIQLIMMAGKMQKQISILAHVYLKRLLKKSKGTLTKSNWRNILLVVLIQGSKIWDDQSLQNHSFAKVIKPYTTLEINRLEKHLLLFLDYELTIDQKQYCHSYFELRKHSNEAGKTANLVKLDIKTIKKLQQGAKKSQGKLKDFYEKCLNKSF